MPSILTPDNMGSLVADIDRRLRILEAAPRFGYNRIRFAYSTATTTVATYGAWEFGAAGCTYQDDAGNTGAGYPQVTVQTGNKALIFMQSYAYPIAFDVNYRTSQCYIGCAIDGTVWGGSPISQRWQTHGPTTEGNQPLTLVHVRNNLVPGNHTFTFGANWPDEHPAAANMPTLQSPVLIVIPVD